MARAPYGAIHVDGTADIAFHVEHEDDTHMASWRLGPVTAGLAVYLMATPDELRSLGHRLIREANKRHARIHLDAMDGVLHAVGAR